MRNRSQGRRRTSRQKEKNGKRRTIRIRRKNMNRKSKNRGTKMMPAELNCLMAVALRVATLSVLEVASPLFAFGIIIV